MVEWKKLGEVCSVFDGTHQTPKYTESGVKFVSVENIDNLYFTNKYISKMAYSENYKIKPQKGDVLMTRIGDVGRCAIITKDEPIAFYVSLALLRPNPEFILCNYLKHIIESKTGRIELRKRTLLTAVPLKINLGEIGKIKIPIPSLEEQNRIVGILDTFTDSIENLKQQIDQRRKQYAYLIDNFFGGSLSEMKKKAENGTLHIEPLSAHGTFTRGRRFVRTDVVEEGQPCIHYGDMYTYYGLYADKANTHLPYDFPKKMRYAKKGDVVIVGAGENNEDIAVGLVWLGDEPAAVHDACYIYESDFEPMYLSYFLRSSIYHLQIKSHVVRGKICSISSDGIGKALIPIFPMEKQKEIVSKLLPFESLLKNLEAQLEQRQKQYEYYRNQLLTFE